MTALLPAHPYLARVVVIVATLGALFAGLVVVAILCTAVEDWLRRRE